MVKQKHTSKEPIEICGCYYGNYTALSFKCRLKWVQMQETKYYCQGAVVVLDSSSCTLPTFGQTIDIVVVDVDIPLFVCEILETEEIVTHLHAFVVKTKKPIPITILKQNEYNSINDFCYKHSGS